MPEATATPAADSQRVEPDVYTSDYYLSHCQGYEEFLATGGTAASARVRKALALAGDLDGKRVLDVGCGRGELVLQPAMQGADAWGIDYAGAAVEIAKDALGQAPASLHDRMHVAQMDVKSLVFADAYFDVAFKMDVVEHLYQHELEQAYAELHRVLRPGGSLIIHTSPNRVLEERVYPHYVRRWNQAARWLTERFNYKDEMFNRLMLPVGEEFPHSSWEREMHINPQTLGGLKRDLARHGFRVRRAEFWEPPLTEPYFRERLANVELRVFDFLRFLRPISRHAPLSGLFCNHMWVVAERV